MSKFKNLRDEDVLRIRRGIAYSLPARAVDGAVCCVGNYGDMVNQVRFANGDLSAGLFDVATDRLEHWFCLTIDSILEGEEFLGSSDWKIVEGKPVAPHPITTAIGNIGYVDTRAAQ